MKIENMILGPKLYARTAIDLCSQQRVSQQTKSQVALALRITGACPHGVANQ
jgi:hypothetical protein